MITIKRRLFTYEDVRAALNMWLQSQNVFNPQTQYVPLQGVRVSPATGFLVEETDADHEPESGRSGPITNE